MKYSHTRLLVTDASYENCFRFYSETLGFKVKFGEPDDVYAEFDSGACSIALYRRKLMAEAIGASPIESVVGQDRVALIFQVDSVDKVFADLSKKKISFVKTPHDQPIWGLRVAHFRDPDGNLIEICNELNP